MTSPCPPVLILYNAPVPGSAESEAGVLEEVAAVAKALSALKAPSRSIGIRTLKECHRVLASAPEPVVFNLVEGLEGPPTESDLVPAVCQAHGKAVTGNDTGALLLTRHKQRTLAILKAAGIPVPEGFLIPPGAGAPASLGQGPWIIKPVATDASEGIDSARVFQNAGSDLDNAIRDLHQRFAQDVLLERYVGTREFNVSVLERGGIAEVLPIAEIDFSAFAEGQPRIVDYSAKWLTESFAYHHTPRILPARISETVAEAIRTAAHQAWMATGCRGYARVDLRMDASDRLFILEINANPDISADAGFTAALTAAGITYADFVRSAVLDALAHQAQAAALMEVPDASAPDHDGIRRTLPADRNAILEFTQATGFFPPSEFQIAREVLDEALMQGPDGHYQSRTLVAGGTPAGWVCWGPTPCTRGTYDIYWLVVDPKCQRHGFGRQLMEHAEECIQQAGGRLSVVETSGRALYDRTRAFYIAAGYQEQARIPDFYAPGDDKIVLVRRLDQGH